MYSKNSGAGLKCTEINECTALSRIGSGPGPPASRWFPARASRFRLRAAFALCQRARSGTDRTRRTRHNYKVTTPALVSCRAVSCAVLYILYMFTAETVV